METTTQKVSASGNGTATSFSFSPLVIFQSSDLVVVKVASDGTETTLTETTDYTVVATTDYPSTGSITYPATGTTKLATGESLVMKRVLTIEQTTDLENQGGYFPDTQETALDKLTMIDLQQQEDIDRSLKFPVSDDSSLLVTLPVAADRAGKGLVFDNDGNVAAGSLSSVAVSSAMEAVVQASTLATARADFTTAFIATLLDDTDAATALATLGTLTDAGATEGPTLPLYRDSSSPAASDLLGALRFDANSSTAVKRAVAKIAAKLLDATNASEDAQILFQTIVAGTLASAMILGQGLQVGSPTGGDKGAGSVNAVSLYLNGTAMTVPVLTGRFVSSELALPAAGSSTTNQAHGLSATPIMMGGYIECKTADAGYAVGDRVALASQLDNAYNGTSNIAGGASIHADATNIALTVGSGSAAWQVVNKSTGGITSLTTANWKLVLWALL